MPAARICRLWTIGHSTRTADDFLELLRAYRIDRLADIRTIPQSRRYPHFGRVALETRLMEKGIAYRHFPGLGGLRKPRPDSPNGAWRNQAFRGYADHMLTPEFAAAVDELLIFGDEARAAVMCAEAVWWRCHRMLLSDALAGRGVDVQHILNEAKAQPHRLTPFAKLQENGRVSYPPPLLAEAP
jgi:uncharacterized protein (DUF488 family)